MNDKPKTISVAPMIDWTDRHCRYFHRLLSPTAILYTEMVTAPAILYGDKNRHLDFSNAEHPLILQLGGSDAADLATCTKLGEQWGYDGVNLNCGCPSDRVQKGRFGACLMKEPDTVATIIAAMKRAAPTLPVTVKCRIGVDECDDEIFLDTFVKTVRDAGCDTFIIHARKAWLKGLSPKQNREVPPLRYDVAAHIKSLYPDLTVILNGGVRTIDDVRTAFQTFDGVMIGRAAYENPYLLAELELAFNGRPLPDRADIAHQMMNYITERRSVDPTMPINAVVRHMLGLYQGARGAKSFRRILTEGATNKSAGVELIEQALAAVEPIQLAA